MLLKVSKFIVEFYFVPYERAMLNKSLILKKASTWTESYTIRSNKSLHRYEYRKSINKTWTESCSFQSNPILSYLWQYLQKCMNCWFYITNEWFYNISSKFCCLPLQVLHSHPRNAESISSASRRVAITLPIVHLRS